MLLARRTLLGAAALAPTITRAAWARNLSHGAFTHGVASGDPQSDGVILWTRFVGSTGRIAWEVSEDEAFARVARRGEARARLANDFCVKVDVRGLSPGQRYFYRFLSASGPSETGRTLTAPLGGASRLAVALLSCANFPFGYFHAYGHAAAREDVDLAIHVGDYIYEYERGVYPSAANAVPGRILEPAGETVRLADYYHRYATYHTDPDLLELRRLKPISAVWDDHELANDTWRDGAQNHQAETEGEFADRIAAATKAYFDWMPLRRPDARGPRLYRHLDWGDLARLLLLDTRFIGRDRQLDYRTTIQTRLSAGENVASLAREFNPALQAPNRTLLGAAQEAWLADSLLASKCAGQAWQIIAQQVQVATQTAPADIGRLIGPEIPAGGRTWFENAARLTPHGLPWNLDTWNGYPAARARLLEACAINANNAVILGGDSHNCWISNLPAAAGARIAALEFSGGSVSSPGFERTLTAAQVGERESAMLSANPDLAFCDVSRRGYGVLTLTRSECEAQWLAFDDVRSQQMAAPRVARLNAQASARGGPGAWTLA